MHPPFLAVGAGLLRAARDVLQRAAAAQGQKEKPREQDNPVQKLLRARWNQQEYAEPVPFVGFVGEVNESALSGGGVRYTTTGTTKASNKYAGTELVKR